jgi:hypothetical protein
MTNLDRRSFDKERIKSRILKRAADQWGYKEGEMESFDPLIKLLIEAFAGELEKIGFEINETQLRIIERLTGLISPELNIVSPSFAIVQGRAVDPGTRVDPNSQLLLKRVEDRGKSSGNKESTEVFYSPVSTYPVFNATLLYVIVNRNAYSFENGVKKIPVIENDARDPEDYNCLWLGLDLEEDLPSLDGMSFFFNWYNEPQKQLFSQYLPFTEWSYANGQKIAARPGLNPAPGNRDQVSLENLFNISKKLEDQVSAFFNNYFITLHEPVQTKEQRTKRTYPLSFERKFTAQELKSFRKELCWLKIKFPDYCPPEILTNILCAMNCFPVINRRIHRTNYKAQQSLNVIPLESPDSFLTVKDVRSAENKVYKGIPLAALNEVEVAAYTVRTGINRLDPRQAQEILSYLLELLQDESASFAAIGEDFLTSQLVELNQHIARLEQRLKNQSENRSSNPFMVLNAMGQGETVFIEYWSTQGESANNIPSGTKLSLYSGSYLDNNSIYLMTMTAGGHEKPRGEKKINLLKKSLLSRDRIVTLEDIRIACWESLDGKVRDVRIKKIFETGNTPFHGFIRTILVEIIPLDAVPLMEEEWATRCEKLRIDLESKSTANWPYKIVVKK